MSAIPISSEPSKAEKINKVLNAIVVAVPLIAILVVLLISGGETTDASRTVGDWQQSTDSARHVAFKADRTVSMNFVGSSAPGALEFGVYTPNIDGMGTVDMKSGRRYTVTFREFTPNQFDLQDQETGSVTVFKRAQ